MPRRRPLATLKTIPLLAAGLVSLAGCGSPPSVVPILRIADATLRAEASYIDTDLARLRGRIDQSRADLDHAFESDLEQVKTPDRRWVLEAAQVYAAAREHLAAHQQRVEQDYERRRENLLLAADAQRRSIALLQKQDRLLMETLSLDLWRLLDSPLLEETD